jgi:alpha-L-rhamnosidase
VVGDVTSAKANYQSPYGVISSNWKKQGGQFKLSVNIPANTTAVVYLPVSETAAISVNGEALKTRKDMLLVGYKDGRAMVAIGSGIYNFEADAAQ